MYFNPKARVITSNGRSTSWLSAVIVEKEKQNVLMENDGAG
jgi:hypothetical protein